MAVRRARRPPVGVVGPFDEERLVIAGKAEGGAGAEEAELAPPRRETAVELADGRRIGIAEFGPADGFPVVWSHGTPGARRQIPPSAVRHAHDVGVRIIGAERPGVGWSTAHRYHRIVDWADDVAEVVDELGVDDFGVVGLSGGGPFALATAAALGDRVTGAAVLGGVAPSVGDEAPPGGLLGRVRPLEPIVSRVREPIALGMSTSAKALTHLSDELLGLYVDYGPTSDRAVLARPEMQAMFIDDIVNAAEHQFKGIVYDIVLFMREWGFNLSDIDLPVFIWQGDADAFSPVGHGQHMADLIADSQFHFMPGAGHLATLDAASDAFDLILESRGSSRRERA
jgi:pimeloyl-ACP methyl ester carboxylesterase